jgi:hypothetical protein
MSLPNHYRFKQSNDRSETAIAALDDFKSLRLSAMAGGRFSSSNWHNHPRIRDAFCKLGREGRAVATLIIRTGKSFKQACDELEVRPMARSGIRDRVHDLVEVVQFAELDSACISRVEALSILSDIARTTVHDIVEFDTNGVRVREVINERHLRGVESVKMGKYGLELKMRSPLEAIRQIGQLMGWQMAQGTSPELTNGNKELRPSTIRLVPLGSNEDDIDDGEFTDI